MSHDPSTEVTAETQSYPFHDSIQFNSSHWSNATERLGRLIPMEISVEVLVDYQGPNPCGSSSTSGSETDAVKRTAGFRWLAVFSSSLLNMVQHTHLMLPFMTNYSRYHLYQQNKRTSGSYCSSMDMTTKRSDVYEKNNWPR